MTITDAVSTMLGGSGHGVEPLDKVTQITYCDCSTTEKDVYYDGNEVTYGNTIEIPDHSIIIIRYDSWTTSDGKNAYSYTYSPYEILISGIDTTNEQVYGIKDVLTDKTYLLEVVE